MHSRYVKEVNFNFINNANVYNVTIMIITGIYYIGKHYFPWWKLAFFNTKFKDTRFSII